jgi:hypothetical protein
MHPDIMKNIATHIQDEIHAAALAGPMRRVGAERAAARTLSRWASGTVAAKCHAGRERLLRRWATA